MASRISLSTSFSGRWSLISWCVRKPRVLPILMSVFSSWRRLATSSSVSVASSRPNSRISARSLARDTFMRSGLALALVSASAAAVTSASASRSAKSSSAGMSGSFFAGSAAALPPRLALAAGAGGALALARDGDCAAVLTSATAFGAVLPLAAAVSATTAFFLSGAGATGDLALLAGEALDGAAGFLAVMRFLVEWAFGSPVGRSRCRQRTTRDASPLHAGRASAKRTPPKAGCKGTHVGRSSGRERVSGAVLAGEVGRWG